MRVSWLAALCLLHATNALARPYTIDDMLALESYGHVEVDPAQRWAIVERRAAWQSAARFSYASSARATSKLMLVDLMAPGELVPAFEQEDGAGYWSGGFSPSGNRLVVFRLADDRLSIGIADLARRNVRWLGISPDLPIAAPMPIWASEDELILVTRAHGDLPAALGGGWEQRRIASDFARQAAGEVPSVRVHGSGAYRDLALRNDDSELVRIDLRTEQVDLLARGSITDVALSPDHSRLAVTLRGRANQPDPDRPVRPSFQPRQSRLVILNMEDGGIEEPCPRCDFLPNLLDWSSDGDELLVHARPFGHEWESGALYSWSAATRRLTEAAPGLAPAIESAGGSNLALRARWAGEDILLRAAGEGEAAPAWFRVRPAGIAAPLGIGTSRLLAVDGEALWGSDGGRLVRADGGSEPSVVADGISGIGVTTLEPFAIGTRLLFNPRLDRIPPLLMRGANGLEAVGYGFDGAITWRARAPADGSVLLAAAPRHGAAIWYATDQYGAGRLVLSRSGAADVPLDRINHHLEGVERPRRQLIRSTSPDGGVHSHWLTLPPNTGARVPMVVIPYPGTSRTEAEPPPHSPEILSAIANPSLLVGAGYAVLEPSIPLDTISGASDIQQRSGVDFAMTLRENAGEEMGDAITRLVLEAVDAALATGTVDPDRIAVYGQSFGGYAATAIAARTDRFAAIIASAGVHDFFAGYGLILPHNDIAERGISLTVSFGWFEAGQSGMGAAPWAEPDAYVRRSPLFAADRIETPLLLIHGDVDFAPYSSAERLFMAMHRRGRDAILLRYGGEGHFNTSPANIRDQWERVFAFLRDRFARAPHRPQ